MSCSVAALYVVAKRCIANALGAYQLPCTAIVALPVFYNKNKKTNTMSITGLCYCQDRFNSILTLTVGYLSRPI